MRWARILVLLCGVALPYLARLPGGSSWLKQYTDIGIEGWFFFGAFNAIAWGAMLIVSAAYRHPVSLLAPAVPGFGFLAWAHGTLDLASDAQASIALVFIPVLALVPISVGGLLGYAIDRRLARRGE
ncbi:MAG: hypothetical protein RJA99_1472 [Pseudomonadota bacterium]|jgi:hypothetical protein